MILQAESNFSRIEEFTSQARRSLRRSRFVRALRHNPISIIGIVIAIIFFTFAIIPESFTQYNPIKLNLGDRLLPPSSEHWFGTDSVGLDIYTRVIFGARTTLLVVIVVLSIATSIGYLVGATAGYFGSWYDDLFMRLTDIILAFPSLILAVAVNAALGRGLTQTMLAVGFSWWPSYARLIRGQVLSVKNEEYVTAARSVGAGTFRVLVSHVLRNSFDPVVVRITLDVGFVALTTAGLSFLGLGAEPPTPEWGRMVADGRDYLLAQWWVTTFPGLALFMVVVGFNLVGEVLRDWLDPSVINR